MNYADWTMETFGLQSLMDLTSASFSMALLHYYCSADYDNINDDRLYPLLSSSIIGGLCVCTQHQATCRSERLEDKGVSPEDSTDIIFFDYRMLYGFSLGLLMFHIQITEYGVSLKLNLLTSTNILCRKTVT